MMATTHDHPGIVFEDRGADYKLMQVVFDVDEFDKANAGRYASMKIERYKPTGEYLAVAHVLRTLDEFPDHPKLSQFRKAKRFDTYEAAWDWLCDLKPALDDLPVVGSAAEAAEVEPGAVQA